MPMQVGGAQDLVASVIMRRIMDETIN